MSVESILEELDGDVEALAAVTEKFGLKTEDDVEGLLNNQQKLKKEKLKLKAKLEQFGDNDPEDITRLQERIQELESGKKGTSELSTKERMELDKLKKQVDGAVQQGEFWKGKYTSTLRDNLIDKILDENKVNPAFKRVLRSDLASATKIVEEDGEVSLIISTEKGDSTLAEYAKEYFASDEGKVFLARPNNIGGGAGTLKGASQSKESVSDLMGKVASGSRDATMEVMNRIDKKQTQ